MSEVITPIDLAVSVKLPVLCGKEDIYFKHNHVNTKGNMASKKPQHGSTVSF